MMLSNSQKSDKAKTDKNAAAAATEGSTTAAVSDDATDAMAGRNNGAFPLSNTTAQIRGKVQSIFKSFRGNHQ